MPNNEVKIPNQVHVACKLHPFNFDLFSTLSFKPFFFSFIYLYLTPLTSILIATNMYCFGELSIPIDILVKVKNTKTNAMIGL